MRLLALTVLLLALAPAAARAQAEDPGGPLVYVFVLDGLDGDRVDNGRAPYLASLLTGEEGARATYFRESRSIMVAETNPNHTAMATGAYGDRSGIPGNAFALYGGGAECAGGPVDETKPPVQTDGERPSCLLAETFFEAAQRAPAAASLVTAGIFGKPKLASIFAGKKVNPARYDADYLWAPCLQPSDETPYCKQVPNRGFDEYAILDSTVMDEVLRTVREGVAGDGKSFEGGGRRPNLTFVNFPGIDSSGHGTGAGAEYDGAIARADEQVRRFVSEQKALGLWGRTTMVVLSDHSMDTTPQAGATSLENRFQRAGIPSGAFRIVQNGSAALVYLANRRDPGRFELLKKMRAAAVEAAPPVVGFGPPAVEALYREANPADGGLANTLEAVHPDWRLAGPRTGDLVVTSQRGVAFNPVLTGNHGAPQTRDNFFAVIGGSPMIEQRAIASAQDPLFDDTGRNPEQAENVDVAPTVMRLLGRPAPRQSEGRFLAEAFRADLVPPLAPGVEAPPGAPACDPRPVFSSVSVTPARRGLRVRFARAPGAGRARVDVFQSSAGRRVFGNRLVARFTRRSGSVRWNGRGQRGRRVRDGHFFVRLTVPGNGDVRRVALVRRGGRFRARPAFQRAPGCGVLAAFKLEAPVFGGRARRSLDATFRLRNTAPVQVDLLRRGRVVRRLVLGERLAVRQHRVRIAPAGLRRGDYRVRLRVAGTTATLTARRL